MVSFFIYLLPAHPACRPVPVLRPLARGTRPHLQKGEEVKSILFEGWLLLTQQRHKSSFLIKIHFSPLTLRKALVTIRLVMNPPTLSSRSISSGRFLLAFVLEIHVCLLYGIIYYSRGSITRCFIKPVSFCLEYPCGFDINSDLFSWLTSLLG